MIESKPMCRRHTTVSWMHMQTLEDVSVPEIESHSWWSSSNRLRLNAEKSTLKGKAAWTATQLRQPCKQMILIILIYIKMPVFTMETQIQHTIVRLIYT